MSGGFIIRPGQGEARWTLGGRFTTLMGGEHSDEHVALIEAEVARGGEPPLRILRGETEGT